jgi:hypothetical protein
MFINLLKWLNSVDGTVNRLTEVLVNVKSPNRNRMTPIKRRNRVKCQFTLFLLLIYVILFQPRVSRWALLGGVAILTLATWAMVNGVPIESTGQFDKDLYLG